MNNHSQEDGSDNVSSIRRFLAGVLIGGLAGAGVTLLLAPQSGKMTRAQIQLKGIELSEQTSGIIEDAVAQARDKAHQITTDVRVKAEELQQRGQNMFDEQRERLSTFVEGEKKVVEIAVKSSADLVG